MAKVMKYEELVARMPVNAVELVEMWLRQIEYRKKGAVTGKDLTDIFIGRVKGVLELMEDMDYITDEERHALYRFYGISKSVADPRFDIIVER